MEEEAPNDPNPFGGLLHEIVSNHELVNTVINVLGKKWKSKSKEEKAKKKEIYRSWRFLLLTKIDQHIERIALSFGGQKLDENLIRDEDKKDFEVIADSRYGNEIQTMTSIVKYMEVIAEALEFKPNGPGSQKAKKDFEERSKSTNEQKEPKEPKKDE